MLGKHEPCDRNRRVNRHGRGGLRGGKVPHLANLTVLLAGGVRVPVCKRVRRERAHQQYERHSEQTFGRTFGHTESEKERLAIVPGCLLARKRKLPTLPRGVFFGNAESLAML
jgi:hypothetical protein